MIGFHKNVYLLNECNFCIPTAFFLHQIEKYFAQLQQPEIEFLFATPRVTTTVGAVEQEYQ